MSLKAGGGTVTDITVLAADFEGMPHTALYAEDVLKCNFMLSIAQAGTYSVHLADTATGAEPNGNWVFQGQAKDQSVARSEGSKANYIWGRVTDTEGSWMGEVYNDATGDHEKYYGRDVSAFKQTIGTTLNGRV